MRKSPRSVMPGLTILMALACAACEANEHREQEQELPATDLEQTQEAVTVNADQLELAALVAYGLKHP